MERDGSEGRWRLRGEGGRRGGQGVESRGGKGTRTGSSRRCNGRDWKRTKSKRQTQVAIAAGESVRGRRRIKEEMRKMDSADKWRIDMRAAGVHGSQTARTSAANELAPEKK